MTKSGYKTILAGFVLMAGLTGVYVARQPMSVEALRENGLYLYDQPLAIDDFRLVDHAGKEFTRDALSGKWTLAFFGYTFCPDICPLTMASLKQFYDLLEASGEAFDVQVIMISVDPQRDTPEKLADYVAFFNPDFIGVTGDYGRIFTVARNMNVTFSTQQGRDGNYLVSHNGEIMLLNPAGDNAGFFKAPHQPDTMLENFRHARRRLR